MSKKEGGGSRGQGYPKRCETPSNNSDSKIGRASKIVDFDSTLFMDGLLLFFLSVRKAEILEFAS